MIQGLDLQSGPCWRECSPFFPETLPSPTTARSLESLDTTEVQAPDPGPLLQSGPAALKWPGCC